MRRLSLQIGSRSVRILDMRMKHAELKPEESNSLSSDNINISDVFYSDIEGTSSGDATIISALRTEVLAGPLPHPRMLKEYNEIIPNGAERIMKMAELQQESRIEGEKETISVNKNIALGQLKLQKRGQTIAFIVIVMIFGLVALFTFTGHEVVSYILLGIGLAGIISAFTGSGLRNKSEKE